MKHNKKISSPKKSMNVSKKGTIQPKSKHASKKNQIVALIAAPILLLSMYFLIPSPIEILQTNLDQNFFYGIIFFTISLVFISLYFLDSKRSNIIFKVVFTLFFLVTISPSFIDISSQNLQAPIDRYLILTYFAKFLVPACIIIGTLILWLNNEAIHAFMGEKLLESEKLNVENEKSIKVLITKHRYKIGILLILTVISAFVYFYKLDKIDLYSDESETVRSAYNHLQTGNYNYWDFIKDKTTDEKDYRGVPHLYLVSKAYEIFGVSNWATRCVTAFFGIVFIILTFFVSNYLTKSKLVSFFVALAALFSTDFLMHFRWGRMYGMLIPIYLAATFFAYKALSEENKINFKIKAINDFIKRYFDFNFLYAIISLILIYISIQLHINSLIFFVIIYLYILYLTIMDYKIKYLVLSIIGLISIFLFFVVDIYNIQEIPIFTFFKVNNSKIYSDILFRNTFNFFPALVLFILQIIVLFFYRDKDFRNRIVFMLISTIGAFLIFSFILDYSVSFRYISFMVIFSIIIIINFLFFYFKILFPKFGSVIVSVLIISSLSFNYSRDFRHLYVENRFYPIKPSVAYKTINDNSLPNDAVFTHWGVRLYFDGINPNIAEYPLAHFEPYPFDTIYNQMIKHNRGWVTWDTQNSFRIDSMVQQYCNLYMDKMHGTGVDKTNVEVYFYTKEMLKSKEEFLVQRYLPTANINLNNSFTLSFWIRMQNKSDDEPFFLMNNTKKTVKIKSNSIEGNLTFILAQNDSIHTPPLLDSQLHHVIYYQDVDNLKTDLFVDNKLIVEKKFKFYNDSIVKFMYNPESPIYINNISIFLKPLSHEQITGLYNNGIPSSESQINYKNEIMNPDFFWIKR